MGVFRLALPETVAFAPLKTEHLTPNTENRKPKTSHRTPHTEKQFLYPFNFVSNVKTIHLPNGRPDQETRSKGRFG